MSNVKLNIIDDFYNRLTHALEFLNENLFENTFKKVVFLIQGERATSLNTYGVFCREKWKIDGEKVGEISLTAESIECDNPKNILHTLVHEFIHNLAYLNDIVDTDKSGKRHNKHFKELGERYGLVFDTRTPKNGWVDTGITKELDLLFEECMQVTGFDKCFEECKRTKNPKSENVKTFFKYKCPGCQTVIRAKLESNIICGSDGIHFEFNDKLPDEITEVISGANN